MLNDLKAQYAASNPPYGLDQVIGYTNDDLLLDNRMKWWSSDEFPWSGNNTAGGWICDAIALESGGALWKLRPLAWKRAVAYVQTSPKGR